MTSLPRSKQRDQRQLLIELLMRGGAITGVSFFEPTESGPENPCSFTNLIGQISLSAAKLSNDR